MKAKELKKYIQDKIKTKLNSKGFKKSESWFFINENGFTSSIIITCLNYDNSFPTSFSTTFGHLGVEKILLFAIIDENEAKNKKIGGQLFNSQQELYEQGKYPVKDYDIYTFEEADLAINELLNYFLNTIIPKYNKFKDIKELDKKINLDDNLKNDRFLARKLEYGLILAKLVKNPEYESLKHKYRELLRDWSDWNKQELEKVISYLDTHSQEELMKIAQIPSNSI